VRLFFVDDAAKYGAYRNTSGTVICDVYASAKQEQAELLSLWYRQVPVGIGRKMLEVLAVGKPQIEVAEVLPFVYIEL
jgi:hypothetical protein